MSSSGSRWSGAASLRIEGSSHPVRVSAREVCGDEGETVRWDESCADDVHRIAGGILGLGLVEKREGAATGPADQDHLLVTGGLPPHWTDALRSSSTFSMISAASFLGYRLAAHSTWLPRRASASDMDGLGHYPQLEDPTAFHRGLVRLLSELSDE